MIILYLNTITREWFDQNGNPLGMDMPTITYGTTEGISISLKSATPNAGELGVNPLLWEKDILYTDTPNLAAKITIDSDYIHKVKGEIVADVAAGATSVTVKFDASVTLAYIPNTGTLRLFDADGVYEAVSYTSRSQSDDGFTFALADGVSITQAYVSGSTADSDQAPYCSAYYLPEFTTPSEGVWSFRLPVTSNRLREEMEYSNRESVDVRGLELLLYTVDADGNEQPIQAFLLDTVALVGTLGSVGSEAEPAEPQKNEIAALISTLLAAGIDVESQISADGVKQIRIKLSSEIAASSEWSEWVTVGMTAEDITAIENNLKEYVQTELANQEW